MAGRTRLALVIAAAAVLGLGLSVVFFSGGQPAPLVADGPADTGEAMPARPPPETFAPVFEPCAHCHQVGAGARHASGPQLNGIIGDAAAARDYPYSDAMRGSGLVWDEETLTRFLVDPYGLVPGTRMLFEGMPREQAGEIVDYLRSIDADGSATSGDGPDAPAT